MRARDEELHQMESPGLLLIHSFMDEVRFNKSGNEITMVKRREPARTEA